MSKQIVNYKVSFVGATPNQAQAIEGVIQSIGQLKDRDTLPIKKYESELKPLYEDYNLYSKIAEALSVVVNLPALKDQVQERIVHFKAEISTRETAIKDHKSNIDYIDDYIKKIRTHISEVIDDKARTVVYTYDKVYLEPFLDLAMIVFEMSFENPVSKSKSDSKAS